jgi:large subunit ribosomal protein L24
MKIKKNDTVLIITGRDRNKKGKVIKVFPKKNKVVVEGVNILKKHTRPSKKNPKGGIVEFAAPIDVSNVMLICPHCNKPTRVGKTRLKDGTKVRMCKKCREAI